MKKIQISTCLAVIFLSLSSCFSTKIPADPNFWKNYYAEKATPGSQILEFGQNHIIEKTPEGAIQLKRFFYDTKQITELAQLDRKHQNDGPTIYWTFEGQLIGKSNYEAGVLQGLKENFERSTGKLSSTENYVNGKREGEASYFNSTGHLGRRSEWRNDTILESITYDSIGSQIEKLTYKDRHQIGRDSVYEEINPAYPGGEAELLKFLAQNLKYPREMLELGMNGRVYIQYVIEKDGSVSNVFPIRGLSYAFQNEAMRVVKLMPNWSPGYYNGNPVRVKYTLPILFRFR
jgi:periplasmic protein TonB